MFKIRTEMMMMMMMFFVLTMMPMVASETPVYKNKCCFCRSQSSSSVHYCVADGSKGGRITRMKIHGKNIFRTKKELVPEDMRKCEVLCRGYPVRVDGSYKAAVSCHDYLSTHPGIEMCDEEDDERASIESASSYHSALPFTRRDSLGSVRSLDSDTSWTTARSHYSSSISSVDDLSFDMRQSLDRALSSEIEETTKLLKLGAKRCGEDGAEENGCYAEVEKSLFKVRGPAYITAKKKIEPEQGPLFSLVCVDIIREKGFLNAEGTFDQDRKDRMIQELIDTRLGKNVLKKRMNGIVLHFYVVQENVGWHAFVFFTRNDELKDADFDQQFNAFLDGDQEYQNQRFKFLIGEFLTLEGAGWGTRAMAASVRVMIPPAVIVGRDPLITVTHTKLEANAIRGQVLKTDLDLSRSRMVDRVKGILTNLKVSIGVTFECKRNQQDDEVIGEGGGGDCPERLIGTFSFVGASFEGLLETSEEDLATLQGLGMMEGA
jgi:hypothetical protein